MKPILTADDFGMTRGISDAILDLASAHRLSATSCMTNMPGWPDGADKLRAHRSHMSVGLHLNLTLGRPLTRSPLLTRKDGTFRSLSDWIVGPFDRLGHEALEEEIDAQLTMFVEAFGFVPDHIDGHQHVHLVPGIRSHFLAVISRLPWTPKPLIRDATAAHQAVTLQPKQSIKRWLVTALGLGFAKRATRLGLPLNDAFAGFSTFDRKIDYGTEIDKALQLRGARPIVMCHPGHVDRELERLGDPVVARRADEFKALMSRPDLPQRIWHAARSADGPSLDWQNASRDTNHV